MDRPDFIIMVYLLVCAHYRAIHAQYPLRRGGFAPALTDEEVITIEICGEYFKLATDEDTLPTSRHITRTGSRTCATAACLCGRPPTCGSARR